MVQTKPEAPGAVTPQRKIELFSGTYFAACTLGGIIGQYSIKQRDSNGKANMQTQLADLPTQPSHLWIW
jgi:hypothetical protein